MQPSTVPSDSSTDALYNHYRAESEPNVHVVVYSTVIPVCFIFVLLVVIRRVVIKRRARANRGANTSVYVIPEVLHEAPQYPITERRARTNRGANTSAYVIPNDLHEAPQYPIRDIERSYQHIIDQHTIGTANNKVRKVKLAKNAKHRKTNNNPPVPMDFPRQPVYQSQQSPSYLVPFTALPKNFDYSHPNVEVHSDFVHIKDLNILQRYWNQTENPSFEAYQKQSPYNPNFT